MNHLLRESECHVCNTPLIDTEDATTVLHPGTRGGHYVKFWGRLGLSIKYTPSNFGRHSRPRPLQIQRTDAARSFVPFGYSTCFLAASQSSDV